MNAILNITTQQKQQNSTLASRLEQLGITPFRYVYWNLKGTPKFLHGQVIFKKYCSKYGKTWCEWKMNIFRRSWSRLFLDAVLSVMVQLKRQKYIFVEQNAYLIFEASSHYTAAACDR